MKLAFVAIPIIFFFNQSLMAESRDINQKGVYFFKSRIDCPLAKLGLRAKDECHLLVLDNNDSIVRFEKNTDGLLKLAALTNKTDYKKNTLVASFEFKGRAVTASGQPAPLTVHLKVSKKKNFEFDIHAHSITREDIKSFELEPFELKFLGKSKDVQLTQNDLIDKVLHPENLSRLVSKIISVRDNLNSKIDADLTEKNLSDFTVVLGAEKIGKDLIRSQLEIENQDLKTCSALDLATKDWTYTITSLSSLVPKDVMVRELFTFGLKDTKIFTEITQNGFKKGTSISLSMKEGIGTIKLFGKKINLSETMTAPLEFSRNFFEFSFIGEITIAQSGCIGLMK